MASNLRDKAEAVVDDQWNKYEAFPVNKDDLVNAIHAALVECVKQERERCVRVADAYAANISSPFVVMPTAQANIAIQAAQIITQALRQQGVDND